MKTKLLGKLVRVDSDNENYDSFRNKTLRITHVAYNTKEHPGYDDSLKGEALCDFEDLEGNEIPCSLYEYEFKII
jgi:hypothetical protein